MRRSECSPEDENFLTTRFEDYLRRPSKKQLAAVVRLTHVPIWNLALRITGNHADAADLCQDVYLSLLLNPPAPGSVRSPLGYLSARVLTVDRRRRRSYERRRRREEAAAREIVTDVEAPEDYDDLRRALDELPERMQLVLKLRYFAGLKNREVAAVLGLSVRATEDHLRKGREALERKVDVKTLGALVLIGEQPPLSPQSSVLDNLLRVVENGESLASETARFGRSAPSSSDVFKPMVSSVSRRSSLVQWGSLTAGALLVLSAGFLLVKELSNASVAPPGPVESASSSAETETADARKATPAALAPSSFTIRGVVRDASQRPLPGSDVSLWKEGEEAADRVAAGADGTFLFSEVSTGDYTVRVDHPIWGALEMTLGRVEKNHQVDLRFDAWSSITGEIVGRKYGDSDRFEHLPNVWIEGPLRKLQDSKGFDGARKVEVDSYSFHVESLEPGVFCLYGGLPYGQVFERAITIEKNGERVELEVNVQSNPKKVLRGTAYVGDRTTPLAHAELQGYVKSPAISGNIGLIRTDGRGEFSSASERLLTGSHVLLSRGRDLPSAEVLYATPLGQDDYYEVFFPEPSPRKARVCTPDGEAVPYVFVTFSRRESVPQRFEKRANRHGEFRIAELQPGAYQVEIRSANEQLAVVGASRGSFNRYEVLVDDSTEDLKIEVDPGRFMILEVATTWDLLQQLPLLHPRHFGWGATTRERPRLAPEKKVAYFTTSLFARMTISGPAEESKTFWELQDTLPRRTSNLRTSTSGRYDILVEELGQDEIRYPFLLSGIPDGVTIQVQILAARIGWESIWASAADIDIDPHVEVTVDAPAVETVVEVTDREGNAVNDARFEIPYFTSRARKSHEQRTRRMIDDSDVPAEDVDPYLGILKKYEFVATEGDETTGKWIDAEGPEHPKILRVGPGRYRLMVYPGDDFPILVRSRSAGEQLVHGSQLLRSPRVRFD